MGTKIRCQSADKKKVTFSTSNAVPIWKINARFKSLGITSAFDGPITVTLSYDTNKQRAGGVSDCRLSFSTLRCRQF